MHRNYQLPAHVPAPLIIITGSAESLDFETVNINFDNKNFNTTKCVADLNQRCEMIIIELFLTNFETTIF